MSDKANSISKKAVFFLCSIAGLFLVIEILLQVGVRVKLIPYYYPLNQSYYSYNAVPYFSKSCCVRDSVSGFRWINNGSSTLKVCRGKCVFHQIIKPNNAGFISPSDFEPHKKDSTVFRWLIFGDSFTDGYFLSQNWPSAFNDILRAQKKPIEVHSFALNGSGAQTWCRILDWLNKIGYEYDGVIIACFGNDLSREDFIMEHSGSYCYYGWEDLAEKDKNVTLRREQVILNSNIDDSVNEILSGKYAGANRQLLLPYYFHILCKELQQDFLLRSQSKELFDKFIFTKKAQGTIDSAYLSAKYGQKKMAEISNMLAYCDHGGKRILLASIPDMKGLESYKSEDDIQLNLELKWLASRYHALFFNGYSIGGGQNAGQFFLKYDGHWNQLGSDRFAAQISGMIISESKKTE